MVMVVSFQEQHISSPHLFPRSAVNNPHPSPSPSPTPPHPSPPPPDSAASRGLPIYQHNRTIYLICHGLELFYFFIFAIFFLFFLLNIQAVDGGGVFGLSST